MKRRGFLQCCVAAGTAGAVSIAAAMAPGAAPAIEPDPFQATSVDAVLQALGINGAEISDRITIEAPKVAENGASVPIRVHSDIAGTSEIITIVSTNPKPLAARYRFGKGAVAAVSYRVKMGKTTDVVALVKSGGRYYQAKARVKVTVGGCGG